MLGAVAAAPLSARARVQGANNRIRLAVIGCDHRSGRVFDSFARNAAVQCLAGCDMNPPKLTGFMADARKTFNLPMVTDYRRILDRKDIDAVLIGTPDFSHARIAIDATSAGKDVYVETMTATTVEHLNAMLYASRTSKQIIQVGNEPRSGDHFAEAKTIIDSGVLGNIRHVAIVQPGTGLVGDLGGHHVDVAHWFMNADAKIPQKTAAIGLFLNTPDPDPEQLPDTFSISWEYDNFVMTFANREVPQAQGSIGGDGTFFIGSNGSLQVNRTGYALRPPVPRTIRKARPRLAPIATSVHRGGSTPVERKVHINPRGADGVDAIDAHVKNFLDCIRSRQQPSAHMEIGYHSALPCLLAVESMRQNTALGWDAAARRSRPL